MDHPRNSLDSWEKKKTWFTVLFAVTIHQSLQEIFRKWMEMDAGCARIHCISGDDWRRTQQGDGLAHSLAHINTSINT